MATTTVSVNAAAPDGVIAQRLSRCQMFLPLITAAASLLGSIFGGLYTLHNTKVSQADQQIKEWRATIDQLKWDEDSLIPSAYLLASYNGTPQAAQARELQIKILKQTTQPATFDTVFQEMLSDAASSKNGHAEDVVTDLLDVDRNLSGRLKTLWIIASHNPPPGEPQPTYNQFLQNPTPYFAPSQQPELNNTLALIWELDTFSNGMDCVWNSSTKSCPHLSKPLPDAKALVLINHAAPNFETIMATCQVLPSEGDNQYKCE